MRLTDFSGAKIANVIGKIKKTSIIIILKHCIEQFSPKPRAFNIFYIDFYLWICNNFCYVDLASAKSEAVDTIYILLNLGNENGEKNSNRSYLQENNLHVQHTFFYIFFAVVLHDYNVKLPETSWLPVKWRKCCTCTCSIFFLFFTSLMFTLVEASISHFLTAATKFHVVPRTKNVSFAFFSLSLVLSLVELCWPVALLSVFSIFLRLSLYSRLWAWQLI